MQLAKSCGDKTMATSTIKGKEDIIEQLEQLQYRFDQLLNAICATQTNIQANLLKWVDFDERNAHVKKWLNYKSQLLNENELKVDLQEKKVCLQKMKVYQ